ncbi:MAG: AAA family ATPase, partial [Selenomonadaceae bacterium]|nr:AAA family ATPase [Selenomonadaceae bacterium]
TLNLSMLKRFFSLHNAEENRKLFNGLEIERFGEKYMKEQGTYPTIFLTLKDVQGLSFDEMMGLLREIMSELYMRFDYLENSPRLTFQEKRDFSLILNGEGDIFKLRFSLFNLAKYLAKHHEKKAVILIDEYDSPIINAWTHGYYDKTIDFMRGFLSKALKTNEYLDFAVLTGITRVSKESIFSGLNNLRVYSVLSEIYSDIFGFTVEETENMLKESGFAEKFDELKKWYDGYIIGDCEIYNPWSIINFIDNNCKYSPYWINVSGNAIIKELLNNIDEERKQEIIGLIEGNAVDTPLEENTVYADLHTGRDALYMMLLHTGYLKAVKSYVDRRGREWLTLKIPNREVLLAYESEIMKHIAPRRGETTLTNMFDAMTEGNEEAFSKCLSSLLLNYVSFHDAGNGENFYHGFLLGLSVYFKDTYRIESNKESGYGRFDIAFFPSDNKYAGIIIEIKLAKSEDEMENLAESALKQISDKAYTAEFKKRGTAKIWAYGVAFCGKRVRIASLEESLC